MPVNIVFSGHCPESGRTQSIVVTYKSVQMMSGEHGCNAVDYYCEYASASDDGCVTRGTDGRQCPLYQAAARRRI